MYSLLCLIEPHSECVTHVCVMCKQRTDTLSNFSVIRFVSRNYLSFWLDESRIHELWALPLSRNSINCFGQVVAKEKLFDRLISTILMSTATAMLPPKLSSPIPAIHSSSGQSSHNTRTGDTDEEHLHSYEDTNLTGDSMMILSQSVDSLQTIATNSGMEHTEVRVCYALLIHY